MKTKHNFRDYMFLTNEQAKKLMDMGMDLSKSSFINSKLIRTWDQKDVTSSNYSFMPNEGHIVMGFEQFDDVNTLSITEMFEMLPEMIYYKVNKYSYPASEANEKSEFPFFMSFHKMKGKYYMSYDCQGYEGIVDSIEFTDKSLRNLLFKVIKWLFSNKLIKNED